MLIKEVEFKLVLPRDITRTPGLHVSDVIRDLALKGGILDPKYATEEMDIPLVCLGIAWEEWYSRQFPDLIFHPGEVEKDGIIMSPDGFTVLGGALGTTAINPVGWSVDEIKLTRKSDKNFLDHLNRQSSKVWMWLVQVMAYCHAVETNIGRLHVNFINGNYTFGSREGSPQPRIYEMQFGRSELKQNWRMILSHAERMKEAA